MWTDHNTAVYNRDSLAGQTWQCDQRFATVSAT